MADIHIEKNHNFDFQTARNKAKAWLQAAQAQFGLTAEYQEGEEQDTASIKKAGVDGRAVLTADKIVFEADLAFLAKPLKGMIKEGIEQGLDTYFV